MRENLEQTIEVMQQARMEIHRLRHENEVLAAKVSVMEIFREAIAARTPQQMETAGIDPVWNLEKHLTELQRMHKVVSRIQPRSIADMEAMKQAKMEAAIGQAVSGLAEEPPSSVPVPDPPYEPMF